MSGKDIAARLVKSELKLYVGKSEVKQLDIYSLELNKRHVIGGFLLEPLQLGDRILLKKDLEDNRVLVVYVSGRSVIYYVHCTVADPLNRLVEYKTRVIFANINKRYLRILMTGVIKDSYGIIAANTKQGINIDKYGLLPLSIPIIKAKQSKLKNLYFSLKGLRFVRIPSEDLLGDKTDIPITSSIDYQIESNVEGRPYKTLLYKPSLSGRHFYKKYYAPFSSVWLKDYAIHLRRNRNGAIVLMRRLQEAAERESRLRFYESKPISFFLFCAGEAYRILRIKKVNIYFEKYSAKAEEGTFQVFETAQIDSPKSKQYYIITRDSSDYSRLKDVSGVLVRDTLAAYWAIYRASAVISTETPSHVTVLRSNCRYLRLSIYKKLFVFLQHGVTYMKRHGRHSAYVAGREAEPDFIVVNSKKEAMIVNEMLEIPLERTLVTGMPIFDLVKNNHIAEVSKDIATVMLTWKPYEESIDDLTKTTYYKNTKFVYDELKKILPKENIRVVAHPKMQSALNRTDMSDSMWHGQISEVLSQSKLLVTDYSSVCYNSFYQGGGVIFYQPDLLQYEADSGKLIPNDDEYIGARVFDQASLIVALREVVTNQTINLTKLRTDAFLNNYLQINQFSDGKNIERIAKSLKELGIV